MGSPPAIVRLSPSRRGVSRCARRGAHSGTCLLPRLHGPRLKPEPQPRVAGFDGHDRHGAVGWRGSDAGYAWTNRSDPRRARLNARIGQLSGCAGRRSSPVILSPLSLRRRNAVVERRCRRVPVRLDSGRATVPARRANRRSPQWKQVGARSARRTVESCCQRSCAGTVRALQALRQAARVTAALTAAFGAYGYATRRDLWAGRALLRTNLNSAGHAPRAEGPLLPFMSERLR
jgi:hypothetical protein